MFGAMSGTWFVAADRVSDDLAKPMLGEEVICSCGQGSQTRTLRGDHVGGIECEVGGASWNGRSAVWEWSGVRRVAQQGR